MSVDYVDRRGEASEPFLFTPDSEFESQDVNIIVLDGTCIIY